MTHFPFLPLRCKASVQAYSIADPRTSHASLQANARKCPSVREGIAIPNDQNLLVTPRSHSKDEAIWQEQLAQRQWNAGFCPPGVLVVTCQMQRYLAEQKRGRDTLRNLEDQRLNGARSTSSKR